MLTTNDLILESKVRALTIMDVANKMMIAARTAPKGRGVDNLVIAIAEKAAINKIAETMKNLAQNELEPPLNNSFIRDANNLISSEGLFLIGTKIKPMGLAYCGLCGFNSCQEKLKHPTIPCTFNTTDLGIALGSAVSVAMDHRVDNRIMYTIGIVVKKLKLLGEDVEICYGVPLSVSGKNHFFDRK